MLATLSNRMLRPFSRDEDDGPTAIGKDGPAACDGPEAAVFADLETARNEALGACGRVADLKTRLAGDGTPDDRQADGRPLTPGGYRALVIGGETDVTVG